MELTFYLSATIAVISTSLAITRSNAVHALLYLVLSFLAVAVILFLLGAPFVAALEIIIYAGTIMVLAMFAIMMLSPGPEASQQTRRRPNKKTWFLPALFTLILLAEVIYLLSLNATESMAGRVIEPKQIGMALFGPYLIGVELASMLLLAGLLGAYLLSHRTTEPPSVETEKKT